VQGADQSQPVQGQQPQQQGGAQQPANPQQSGNPQPGSQQQGNPQQPGNAQQQPTFRENGAFSFFAVPSDPDDNPAPMNWGFKIGWFVLGLIGGMFGLLMAWISTSTLSPKYRRQASLWTWAGFAVQAVVFLIVVLSGGSFAFFPESSTTTQAASTAGTSSTSAFG
jgi:hypothetical protein